MAHASPGFVPGPVDELSVRTLPTFFGVLELLLRAGVTTVAEAAFQDRLWRPGLEALRGLARIRVVHCVVDAGVAHARMLQRAKESSLRRVHAEPNPDDPAVHAEGHNAFRRVSVEAPWIEVDTTRGYDPDLGAVVDFVSGRSPGGTPGSWLGRRS
ncbi:hypothetical protein SAMN05444320_10261 [Streptoalloteichus hindustanus]|uniref:Uncharacterized protein n=2 Tax=Streptoalloteichus hindustanus TaxID=2017 RepID=A0A1M4XP29_STRHI|nr:hypothetical protein SAMN05444320_10261 [Streptoalloteichus hindustanus]